METTKCPFCQETIKIGAIKCKHCRTMIVEASKFEREKESVKDGTLWLPVPCIVFGIISCIALLDDTEWGVDEFFGFFMIAITSFVLGIISVSTQRTGRGIAISGIVLSSVSLLIGLGAIIE